MTEGGPCLIETSPLICKGNQYIGLYMIGISLRIELKLNEGRNIQQCIGTRENR